MPYIEKARRNELQPMWNEGGDGAKNVGELNYIITQACADYLGDVTTYGRINSIIGVLECAKQEFYRRIAADYEDLKIIENGDVYDVP